MADETHRIRLIVGLGGSATSDVGIGMLKAVVDVLAPQQRWDDIALLHDLDVTIACDVNNPLCGPMGAAHVFGPQKGATSEMVAVLDERAYRFALHSSKHFGYDRSETPGAGAAGGLGYAFMQYFGARQQSGIDLLLDTIRFDDMLEAADVVITGGELLTEAVKGKLKNKFSCTVQTHYSCTEAGEIACECREGHLHINEDWVIVEPVDRDGKPVGDGVLSDRVLVTNLANRIQPFIRYELTDRIIVHSEPCSCGRNTRWLEIEGRTDDTLVLDNGVKVAPMSLYRILEEVKGVRRFQLVQTASDELELRLICEDPDAAFAEAERELQAFFADRGVTNLKIRRSKQMPQADPVSGKFKHVYRTF